MPEKDQIKILIADDSLFMRKVLRQILVDDGYTKIIECEDGQGCIEICKQETPNLILLDLIMPNLNGIEVLKQIGNSENILIISAIGQESMIEEAKQLGAKEYITKPFLRETVIEKINNLANIITV